MSGMRGTGMEDREWICIQPEYVARFQCDGSKCQSKCCQGWQITLDAATCHKYEDIPDAELRQALKKDVVWHAPSRTHRMKMRPNGACPMLRDDMLCRIQRSCGESYLSDTCASFPRRTFRCGTFVERALSLACPVAARLALLDPAPMRLVQVTLQGERSGSFFQPNLGAVPQGAHLLSLQMAGISILQTRQLTLHERLAALGRYCQQVDALLQAGQGDRIDALMDPGPTLAELRGSRKAVGAGAFQPDHWLRFLLGLLDVLYGTGIVLYSDEQINYVPYITEAFGLDGTPKPLSELRVAYQRNRKLYQQYVVEPYGHVLEHYLVQEYFNDLYPCKLAGSCVHNFAVYLVFYEFLELVLMSVAAKRRDQLTVEDILGVIERLAQRTDHASVFLAETEKALQAVSWSLAELLAGLVEENEGGSRCDRMIF